jgi:hypothetical protein
LVQQLLEVTVAVTVDDIALISADEEFTVR